MAAHLVSSDAMQRFLDMLNPEHRRLSAPDLFQDPKTIRFLKRLTKNEKMWESTFQFPLKIEQNLAYTTSNNFKCLWLFQNRLYVIKHQRHYSDDECALLVREEFDKSRRKMERLKKKFETGAQPLTSRREKISESVRIEVWRRDEGKCVRCGSRNRLEYDHIIPISKGGSNTARNIELLCELCNREKSDEVQ